MPASVMHGQLRVAVIGAQAAEAEGKKPYMVFRTAVTYRGECYERLIRYRVFRGFYKRVRARDSKRIKSPFPGRTLLRGASFEDEVVETRQVLLNEFMREICNRELSPKSEEYLMKMLRIGKHEDGKGRVSDLSSRSLLKGERPTVDVLQEVDEGEEMDDVEQPTVAINNIATLTSSTVAFPSISSNADTVWTDADRSTVLDSEMGSDEQRDIASSRSILSVPSNPSSTNSSHLSKSSSSIGPSKYSANLLTRPQLRSSQSLPVPRRSKKVAFSADLNGSTSTRPSCNCSEGVQEQENCSSSPEHRFLDQINYRLSSISRLLSDSDTASEHVERTLQQNAPSAA
ncbi:hypothetical protein Poli38472_000096 [Pythium oligandrum]|uniref:PX domain-containing protein n=1 Tax=Pythium oligandrum TaxID=41045 RepID=A0A8K1CB17_PYTOL|nr:hypothetical protein Poli38472_000096 [Pythium oligandrum]|eukprot:TMW60054.1 hypothetical protein Poli38472_000096 [Pythium oligandrum]